MKEKVLKIIRENNLIETGDKLVLGVSGGPDSIAMLNVLSEIKDEIKFEIAVAHINHMIREEAEADEEYVKNMCNKMNVEFYAKKTDVQKLANTNKVWLEETGRKVRYEFFEEVLKNTKSNKIAIAHNKNDKAETVLMNILRGSGIQGLKGIELKNKHYIRPLLECERNEIEDYCTQKNLNPRIDKTNFENEYTRNKVRNIVIPYIQKEFNPNIIETINRLSELTKQEDEYLKTETKKVYNTILVEEKPEEIILNLKGFNKQEKLIKSRIIMYSISKIFGTSKDIEKIHIEDIIKLCQNNIGNKYLTPNKNTRVLVKNHKIYISKQKWASVIKAGKWLDCNKKDI